MFELKVASLLIFSWCERQLRVCLFGIKLNQCNAMHHCNVMMQDSVVLWLTFLDIFDVDISLKKKLFGSRKICIWVRKNVFDRLSVKVFPFQSQLQSVVFNS